MAFVASSMAPEMIGREVHSWYTLSRPGSSKKNGHASDITQSVQRSLVVQSTHFTGSTVVTYTEVQLLKGHLQWSAEATPTEV